MWASSQPRENEQCLLRGVQNSLSQWNVPASQAEGNFYFFFKTLVGTVLARQTRRRGSAMGVWGWPTSEGWLYFGWPLRAVAIYAPFLLK